MLRVYPEERVERLDLDVEKFHQRNRHGPQVRKAATNRDLRHRVDCGADRRQKLRELVDKPGSQIVAALRRLRGSWRGRRPGSIFIPPRQFARAEQRAVAYERDARERGVEGHIRFDPARNGKRLSRSRQAQKGVGWRHDRSNAEASIDERPDRRRHIARLGEREHHGLPVRAFNRRRRRRNVGDCVTRVYSRSPGRRERLGPHLFVGAVRHDHLPVITVNAPHDDGDGPAAERREPPIGLGARGRQDGIRPHAGRRRLARHEVQTLEFDEPARCRRQFNADARAQVPPSCRFEPPDASVV